MPAEQFSAYLKEKGLERILALREQRGESQRERATPIPVMRRR